jgi:hypothetical protein
MATTPRIDTIETDIAVLQGGGGGSESGLNYFLNGNFEADASNGVSVVNVTSSAETTTPLFDDQSNKLTSSGSAGTADFSITGIDNAVLEGGIVCLVTGYLKTDAGVADGDWTVGVYNTTDASYATSQTDLKADTLNVHRTTFAPVTGKTYVLRVVSPASAAKVLVVDRLTMTPESNSGLVEADGPLLNVDLSTADFFDSTGFSQIRGGLSMKRQGSSLLLDFSAEFTGTASNGVPFQLVLPTYEGETLTVLEGVYPGGSSQNDTTSAGANRILHAFANAGDADTGVFFSTPGTGGGALLATQFGSGVGDIIHMQVSTILHITNWQNQGKVNLLTQEVVQANVRAKYQLTTSNHGSNVTLDYSTPYDSSWTNVGDWSNTAGAITIPVKGTYDITASVQAPPNNGSFACRVDGVDSARFSISDPTTDAFLIGTCTLDLEAGQVITAVIDQISALVTGRNSMIQIIRRQDYGAFDPVGFGLATSTQAGLVGPLTLVESSWVDNRFNSTTAQSPTSLALTPGVWLISGSARIYRSLAAGGAFTNLSRVQGRVSTTAASISGGTNGKDAWEDYYAETTNSSLIDPGSGPGTGGFQQSMPQFYYTATSNVTLYVSYKMSGNFDSDRVGVDGYISALKIRD